MTLPSVAIVGRPNVGKSTLFNALARRRVSIVEPTSGVTRDRVSTVLTSPDEQQLELIDTGGMGVGNLDALADDVEEQIGRAVTDATALVFVVDATVGCTPQDREIAARLRTLDKPLLLVANKTESARAAELAAEFHGLGLGEPALVSAVHKTGIGGLRERLFGFVAAAGGPGRAEPELKIAFVGQRNVGKSTLINRLAREARVIVSERPGTTRDSVDVRFQIDGTTLIATDTAGLRKKQSVKDSVEFYSHVRVRESVARADVVLFLFDACSPVTRVDKKLAKQVTTEFKPCVIVVNKWDLAKDVATEDYAKYFTAHLPELRHAPISFVSALEGRGVRRTIDVARSLWKQARTRVSTAELNAAIEELKTRPGRWAKVGRRPKIYYATQIGTCPPTILLFVNAPEKFGSGARSFIRRFFRERLPFHEVPVAVRYRQATGRPS